MMGQRNQTDDVRRRVAALTTRFRVRWKPVTVAGARFELAVCASGEELLSALIAAGPDDPAVRDERLPYWTECWPAARALAARVMERAAALEGLRVLDLGCGLGLPGVAAGRCGARVVFCDYDEWAARFAALNWAANLGGTGSVMVMDWREPACGASFDRILAADIVYEKRFYGPVLEAFDRLLKPDGEVWLGEPNRAFSGDFFNALRAAGFRYEREERRVPDPNPDRPTIVSVYAITRSSDPAARTGGSGDDP